MFSTRRILSIIVLSVSSGCFLAEESNAQRLGGPRQGWAGFSSYGFGHHGLGGPFEMPYAMGRVPTPPYYAMHPPVHYSDVVPRTYGYSPFAYPGSYRTPQLVQPEEVVNPHVEPKAHVNPTSQVTAAPVVVRNPFVEGANADVVEFAQSTN